MSSVTADIRIFPQKEMLSVDMAEALDAAILKSGIIQGCEFRHTNGVLSITDGRIIIKGRLGVVTAGDIPVPTLEVITTCHVVAICNLNMTANPFTISILTPTEFTTLQSTATTGDGFNVSSGLAYIEFGTATVDPATGNVTAWTPIADAVKQRKGSDIYEELTSNTKIMHIERKVNLPAGTSSGPSVTNVDFGNDLPAGTKLVGVDVSFDNLHLPYVGYGDGMIYTWISHMNKRMIAIRNRSGAWNNYTMVATLFYVTDPNPNS